MTVRFLLDTNAASHAVTKKSPAFDRRLLHTSMEELAVSALTEAELRYGLARRPSAPLQTTIETFLLAVTIFPWDSDAARSYGKLRSDLERKGQLMGALDMLIAAHALSLDLILVSNDAAFRRIKHLKVEDWTK